MCGNEPCRHERDYTIGQAMKSYVAASALAGDAAIERDAALATLAKVAAIVAEPYAGPFIAIDRILAALEPTPKGTKP